MIKNLENIKLKNLIEESSEGLHTKLIEIQEKIKVLIENLESDKKSKPKKRKKKLKYLTIIEKANKNYSAYIPDIPGCIAAGRTIEETKKNIQEALAMHLEGLKEDGIPSPKPKAKVDYVVTAK